jgi:hypothetical protein
MRFYIFRSRCVPLYKALGRLSSAGLALFPLLQKNDVCLSRKALIDEAALAPHHRRRRIAGKQIIFEFSFGIEMPRSSND